MKSDVIKPMVIIMAAPIFSALLSVFKIVPAPPYQGFASLLYLPICALSLPVAILLGLQKKLLGVNLLVGLIVSFIFPFALFILINPLWMPSGMSNCKEGTPPSATVAHYECEDSSSDDGSYHRDFIIEGYKGWPLMRVIEDK